MKVIRTIRVVYYVTSHACSSLGVSTNLNSAPSIAPLVLVYRAVDCSVVLASNQYKRCSIRRGFALEGLCPLMPEIKMIPVGSANSAVKDV